MRYKKSIPKADPVDAKPYWIEPLNQPTMSHYSLFQTLCIPGNSYAPGGMTRKGFFFKTMFEDISHWYITGSLRRLPAYTLYFNG